MGSRRAPSCRSLSDGKSDNYDGYRGDTASEDRRPAPIEARRDGIYPFCITIDTEARDYLPPMDGAARLYRRRAQTPPRVSDIYRHLTR